MPNYNLILNLPGFSIQKVSGYQPLILDVNYQRLLRCPHCQSKSVRKKDAYMRQVAHELIGHRRTLLRFKAYKLYCNDCKRYGNQQFPGINKYQRATWRLQSAVFHTHTQGVSQKALASQFNQGKATIERWYHKQYHEQARERMNRPCPQVLGMDEHSFSRKGQGFATTLCDLRKHKVFDVVKGRCEKELAGYLETLSGRDRVRVVCIDLSSTYRALIKKYFPNAMIVADRFHVIRLLNHLNLKTYQHIDPNTKYQRGILNVLKTKPDRLSASAKVRCAAYLEQNPRSQLCMRLNKRFIHS